MSKLNYNNIDVQRLLNVLTEASAKFQICAFLSYANLDTNIEDIRERLSDSNPEILKDIEDHFEIIKIFREKHIEIKEEENEKEKNNEEEEEEFDEEGQAKEKEAMKKERLDLKDITENTSDETKALAKSVRKFCRKYYRNEEFLKFIADFRGEDEDIDNFINNFNEVILPHFQKKTKMTLEEEESETNLNTELNRKINDLKDQIRIKTQKYEKLKKDRNDFKSDCQKKIKDINDEIEKLRTNTTNDLNALAEKVNKELNDKKEQNDRELADLKKQHEQAIEEFNEKKKKDADIENTYRDEYLKKENILRAIINDYDNQMKSDKKDIEEKNKEKEQLNIIVNPNKTELDTVENKYKVLNENFLLTQQKNKDVDYENKVKERSVEWIQAQFRGFWTRKTMRKKFKFLKALQVVKIPPPEEDPKKKKKKK